DRFRFQLSSDAAAPDEQPHEYRQQVTNAEIIGSKRERGRIKDDRSQKKKFAPWVDKSLETHVNQSQRRRKQERNRRLDEKRERKVLPESVAAEISEQIRDVIRIAIPVHGSQVFEISPRRSGKQIRCLDHEQGR